MRIFLFCLLRVVSNTSGDTARQCCDVKVHFLVGRYYRLGQVLRNTPFGYDWSTFLQAGCPSCDPNRQCKSPGGNTGDSNKTLAFHPFEVDQ